MLAQEQVFTTATLETIGLSSNDYQKILDEEIPKLDYLTTLITCIKLNLFSTQTETEDPSMFQSKMLKMVYDMGLVGEIEYNFLLYFLKNKSKGIIFHRPALLQLIIELSQTTQLVNPLKVKSDNKNANSSFIKAYLAANGVYNEITVSAYKNRSDTNNVVKSLFLIMIEMIKVIKNSIMFYQPVLVKHIFKIFNDIISQYHDYVEIRLLQAEHKLVKLGYTYLTDFKRVLSKTKLILYDEFFKKSQTDQNYSKLFYDNYGISIEDWLRCNVIIYLRLINEFSKRHESNSFDGLFSWNIDSICGNEIDKQIFFKYLQIASIDAVKLKVFLNEQNSSEFYPKFLILINKPILKLNENEIIIIDTRYFIENLIEGSVFLTSKAFKVKKESDEVLKYYGQAIERFCLSFLKKYNDKLISSNSINISNNFLEISDSNEQELNDVVISKGNLVGLIEVKGGTLKNEANFSQNPSEYIDAIKTKYDNDDEQKAKTDVDKRGKAKGLKQLKKNIDLLTSKNYKEKAENNFLNNISEIIPILLLRDDEQVNVSANYFANQFIELFENQSLPCKGWFTYKNLKIHSLITISVNHLLMLAEINLTMDLLSLFKEYSAKSPDRQQLFTNFLATRQPPVVCFPTNEMITSQAAEEFLTNLFTQINKNKQK